MNEQFIELLNQYAKIEGRDVVTTANLEDLEGAIMKKFLLQIHPYKITPPKADHKRPFWSTYVADESKPNGRRKISKPTEKDLEKALIEYYGDLNKGEMTFGEVFEKWVEYKKLFTKATNKRKGLSVSTVRRYKRDYDNYIKNSTLNRFPIGKLTKEKLMSMLLDIIKDNKMKCKCAGNVLGYVSQILDFAYDEELTDKNARRLMDKELLLAHALPDTVKDDEERVLTTAEYKVLLKNVKAKQQTSPSYMPNYAIELAMYTGMRVGELVALKWEDIRNGYIYIDRSEHRNDYDDRPCEYVIDEPKNLKHRKFPVTQNRQNLLNRIRFLGHDNKEGYIFADKKGTRINSHTVSCATSRRGTESGIGSVSIHEIRRTFSTELNKAVPQKVVASMLGHSELINERHYNYDNEEYNVKLSNVEKVLSALCS